MQYGADCQPLTLGSGRGLLASSHGKAWGGPPVEVHEWGTTEAGRQAGPPQGQLGLVLILSGKMEVTIHDRGRITRHLHQPGTLVLLSGDAAPEVVRTEGFAQGLAIALPDGWQPDHGQRPARDWRELSTALTPDPAALSLGQSLRSELERGAPTGPLYSEALSLSLLSLTQARSQRVALAPRLTSTECQRLRDYIEDNLDSAISIDRLAALIGLRRRQFADCFRATFGTSAYNYVMQRRVARGAIMLARGQSIAETAMAVGFSSQSHFTAVYRRQLGLTPSAGRRR